MEETSHFKPNESISFNLIMEGCGFRPLRKLDLTREMWVFPMKVMSIAAFNNFFVWFYQLCCGDSLFIVAKQMPNGVHFNMCRVSQNIFFTQN